MSNDAVREAGRELDELIAVRVMGMACAHRRERVPADVVAVRIARDWKEQFGTECPPEYALATAAREQDGADHPECWCAICHEKMNKGFAGWSVPKYSLDIAAAFQVIEKMGNTFDGLYPSYDYDPDRLMHWTAVTAGTHSVSRRGHVARTAPLAICRAALWAAHNLQPDRGPTSSTPGEDKNDAL